MRHDDRTIRSVGEFITNLRDTSQDTLVWFRGQKNSEWPLLPNIARKTEAHPHGLIDHEIPAIKRFKQNADAFLLRLPQDEWGWIFLMQHHRGLTRLLDWSESPLVALYFALADCEEGSDGVVWCLDPMALNTSSGHRRTNKKDVLAFGVDEALDSYLPDRVGDKGADMQPIAAIGPRNSRRMIAQSGTFTIMHHQILPVEEVGDKKHVWRLIIPAAEKAALRKELKLLGFNEFMLFPDLETLAIHTQDLLQ
jgi:hypothetical protein